MTEPFIFVTTFRIHEGELDNIKELARRFTDLVEVSDTGLLAFHFYISDDGTDISNVQVHTDATSMDAYLPLVGELIAEAFQFADPTSVEVFGTPGTLTQEVLAHNAEHGVRVRVTPSYLGGFMRPAA